MSKRELALQYAESFRYKKQENGWFSEKVSDFLAGYDAGYKQAKSLTRTVDELSRMIAKDEEDKVELLTALTVLNNLPIEHDENGHAFKRIDCRSILGHGAELQELITKHSKK